MNNLLEKRPHPSNQIADAAGHRIVVPSLEMVQDLEQDLMEARHNPLRLGNTTVKVVRTPKDYYGNPKANGYKALHFVLEVTTSGSKPILRELQITDQQQNYRNEIDPRSKSHHRHRERNETLTRKERNTIPSRSLEALVDIFGNSTTWHKLSR